MAGQTAHLLTMLEKASLLFPGFLIVSIGLFLFSLR